MNGRNAMSSDQKTGLQARAAPSVDDQRKRLGKQPAARLIADEVSRRRRLPEDDLDRLDGTESQSHVARILRAWMIEKAKVDRSIPVRAAKTIRTILRETGIWLQDD